MNNSDLVNLLLPISTNYVFGGSRYEPYNTDCSGMVCAAFHQVFNIDPYTVGTWTGAQWSNDFLDFVWYGYSPDLPYDEMFEGDVIFTSNCSPDFSTGNGSHVGFYTGNPDAPFLSHFADGGPYVTAVNGVYGNECYYGVKRYSEGCDDMNKEELISTRDSGNIPAWQAWSWAYTYSKDTAEAIKNLKVSGAVIDYDKLADKITDKLAERLKD